jgi:tetratricopeptide (TPR) repeat protein
VSPVATSLLIVSLVFLIVACRHRIPSGPPDSELYYRQGLEAFSRATPDGYRDAIGAFRQASSLIPSRCEYRLHLAESLLFLAQEQQINWEESVPSLSEAANSIDAIQSNGACSGFGAFLYRVGALSLSFDAVQHSAALEKANQAIELDPNDAMNWLVLCQLNSADPRMPIDRAKELAPDLALVQNTDGQYRLDRGEYAEAKQAFEHVLQISPLHFRSMTSLGYLASLEFRPESIGLYMKALDISPTFLTAHLLAGQFYAGSGDYEKAIQHYKTAIMLNAKYYPAWLELGRAFVNLERFIEAEEGLKKVLDLNPDAPGLPQENEVAASDAHYLLGQIAISRSELTEAASELQQSLHRARNVDAMSALGYVLYRRGDLDAALMQYETVLRFQQIIMPPREFPDAYLFRGAIRATRQEFAQAISDYNRAIEIYDRQIKSLNAEVETSDSTGLKQKAEIERRRKADLEKQLNMAVDLKANAEKQMQR